MNHTHLVDEAREEIKEVFNDKSVSQEQTAESLGELSDEIQIMVDSLED